MGRNKYRTGKANGTASEEKENFPKGILIQIREIEVDYLDQNFKKQHGKYSGWIAQIIQHEIDHCNGIVI